MGRVGGGGGSEMTAEVGGVRPRKWQGRAKGVELLAVVAVILAAGPGVEGGDVVGGDGLFLPIPSLGAASWAKLATEEPAAKRKTRAWGLGAALA